MYNVLVTFGTGYKRFFASRIKRQGDACKLARLAERKGYTDAEILTDAEVKERMPKKKKRGKK